MLCLHRQFSLTLSSPIVLTLFAPEWKKAPNCMHSLSMPASQSYLPTSETQQACILPCGHSQDSSHPSAPLLVPSSCRTSSAPQGSALLLPTTSKVSVQPSRRGKVQTGRRLLYQVLSPGSHCFCPWHMLLSPRLAIPPSGCCAQQELRESEALACH